MNHNRTIMIIPYADLPGRYNVQAKRKEFGRIQNKKANSGKFALNRNSRPVGAVFVLAEFRHANSSKSDEENRSNIQSFWHKSCLRGQILKPVLVIPLDFRYLGNIIWLLGNF
jgi:hypothetical protein